MQQNLVNYLEEVIALWNLPATHNGAVVTDNASNITAAIARLEQQRLGCFSHTLQLSVHKALKFLELLVKENALSVISILL